MRSPIGHRDALSPGEQVQAGTAKAQRHSKALAGQEISLLSTSTMPIMIIAAESRASRAINPL